MTVDVKLLPLPEMDIYTLGSGVGLRDVRHTPVGFSQKKMSEYARANVSRTIAAKNAELVELRSAIEELRAEVDCANGWNERVSVCRDHVADIVDGICVICTLDAVEAHAGRLQEEVDRLAQEMVRIQQQYDERTACVIVHRGSALACSDGVRDAYLDERRRADRLAELLDQAYGYVPAGTLADQIHCALARY